MRVCVPDKRENVLSEVLKDLYMLKKAIDYQTGTADGRMSMVDSIRDKLKTILSEEEKNKKE